MILSPKDKAEIEDSHFMGKRVGDMDRDELLGVILVMYRSNANQMAARHDRLRKLLGGNA